MAIVQNRKAFHDYLIQDQYEAGLILEGWEVKSIRAARVQLAESYVIIKDGRLQWVGGHIGPLTQASTHVEADPYRTRGLLLNKDEIKKISGRVTQDGWTLVPLELYWSHGKVKMKVGLAKGKRQHDKRAALREKDLNRETQRAMKRV